MPIRTILIDDEPGNIENLLAILASYCPAIEVVETAVSAQEGLEAISKHQPDLVFLDIEMPRANGFDLLESVGTIHFEVIFVTAYNQYAIQAIRFCALDYLLKPIHIPDLVNAVSRLEKKLAQKHTDERMNLFMQYIHHPEKAKRIALPLADEILFAEISDIIRCEGENNYTWFYFTTNKKVLVSKTLKEFEELLSAHGFVRVHRSHLINLHYVQSYVKKEGGYLLMTDQSQVAISRNRKEEVLAKLTSR